MDCVIDFLSGSITPEIEPTITHPSNLWQFADILRNYVLSYVSLYHSMRAMVSFRILLFYSHSERAMRATLCSALDQKMQM